MCDANPLVSKLLRLAVIQHAAVRKPDIIPFPLHIPASHVDHLIPIPMESHLGRSDPLRKSRHGNSRWWTDAALCMMQEVPLRTLF